MIRERFSAICEEERLLPCEKPQGIGVYNEKSLHRVLKRLICEDESAYEIPVGRFVADVLCDGHITEIQTRQLDRLLPKLKYYIERLEIAAGVSLRVASLRVNGEERPLGYYRFGDGELAVGPRGFKMIVR